MARWLSAAIVALLVPNALAGPGLVDGLFRPTAQTPRPAVVRVIATNINGASLGSGALVASNAHYGLVVTNWHVIRDADGPVLVAFPDGFRSPAIVLRADRDWDLAALATWRPAAAPLTVATQPPRPGEPLTIAGYGGGSYREATGRCTTYVSPGGNKPFEMVELSAGARQGDSGGPILNQRGELAGVLFGAALGQTTGSYCGRVRWFLASVADDFQRLPAPQGPDRGTLLAQAPVSAPAGAVPSPKAWMASSPPKAHPAADAAASQPASVPMPPTVAIAPPADSRVSDPPVSEPATPASEADSPPWDQVRNFLACIGAVAILFVILGAGKAK